MSDSHWRESFMRFYFCCEFMSEKKKGKGDKSEEIKVLSILMKKRVYRIFSIKLIILIIK